VILLNSLKARGLVFAYPSEASITWTAHPFLRETFRDLLGCPPERVFDVVAQSLGTGLEERPETKPSAPGVLDRYERLIEATRLAGREQEVFDLYWYGMGGYENLGWVLGEYQRGYRILAALSATGRTEDFAPTIELRKRSVLLNDLAFFAEHLGRLGEAWAIRQVDNVWQKSLGELDRMSVALRSSSGVAFKQGRLFESRRLADVALAAAGVDPYHKTLVLAVRAFAAHELGDISVAREDFASATELEGSPLVSLRGSRHARHHFDLGDFDAARTICDEGFNLARSNSWNQELPWFHALIARINLAEGNDPTPHLDEIRAWTSRTGEMQSIVEAHLLTARHLLATRDPQAALGEAEAGLLHAVACGYGLLRIELLVAMARIRLAWPDPPKAIQAAREALDLAADPECQYAWGEEDAAQVWGEAYFANHEPTLAKRAFTRALEVRKRIEHPGVGETEMWLGRVG
jgi:tetratricopeptide (TPR) repeat protein